MIRILIVDDQKSVRENIKSMLEAEPDLEIVGVAQDGYGGIKLAATLVPDVVLMDLEMPKLNGLAATKVISQRNPDLNVIILTIQDRDQLLFQALNAGAKGYLLKSADVQEIVNTIHLVYEGNKFAKHKTHRLNGSGIENNNQRAKFALPKLINANEMAENDAYFPKRINQTARSQPEFNFSTLLFILKRRYPPALMGFFGVLLGAVLYLIFAKRTYQATASIILQDRQESISELGKDLSSIVGSNEYSPLASQVELIKSKSVLNSTLKNIAQEKKGYSLENISAEQIKENLNITILPNTNIIKISYINADPELASVVLNGIIKAVIAKNTDNIRSEASSVRQFLETKVRERTDKVAQAAKAENSYREQQSLVSLDSQTANLVNSLNNLATQEQNISTQIKEEEAKINNLQQLANVDDAKSAYVAGRIGQDQQLETLRNQLTDVEAQLAAAKSNFTDNNPTVVALQEKKEKILALYRQKVGEVSGEPRTTPSSVANGNSLGQTENGLGQEVFSELITNQTQLEANKDKLAAIQTEKEKINKQISLLPDKVQSLTELVRQQEQANESLQFLQRKLEEARITEAQLISNFQIVEPASQPDSPSSPNIPVVLAIAIVIATILMAGIILLLEKIDRTLYDGKEVEQKLHIPFLATLPYLPYSTKNLSRIRAFLNDSNLYEPYRFLLKSLESQRQNQLKVVVVTSAIADEGKSEIACHLGVVSAMLSKRTLIIDAHLHQPTQHSLFELQLQPGLREIVKYSSNLAIIVQPTKIKNLSVLTSGTPTANSWTILESAATKNILQEAAEQYDLVIIDTPAVSSSCDAYTLSKYSNGIVMVTRPFHTIKNALEKTVIDLQKSNAAILGFVINNAAKQPQKLDDSLQDNARELLVLPSSKPTKNSRKDAEEIHKS